MGTLVPDVTFGTRDGVDLSGVKIKNGEFDDRELGREYSKTRHVENVVKEYEKNTPNTKALIFNVNVAHSLLVRDAFVAAGYDCRHLDSETPDNERKSVLTWFANTTGAILCNVGILTTGFDDTTVQTVVVNRATMSLPLWIQMTGRGSRACRRTIKKFFNIIDLGANVARHGFWSDARDWRNIFHNPAKPKDKQGIAPSKNCDNPECDCIIPAQARTCPHCGKEQNIRPVEYDKAQTAVELLKANVDVSAIMEQTRINGHKPFSALHKIKEDIASAIVKSDLNETVAYCHLTFYHEKVAEWCKSNRRDFDQWIKDRSAEWFFAELKKRYAWEPERLALAIF
jgi:superfamily II DNA or RNA helicase